MTSAVLPRWWGVNRNELHAVTLYQRTGEELLDGRGREGGIARQRCWPFSPIACPRKDRSEVEHAIRERPRGRKRFAKLMPADTFYLAAEFR